MTRHLHLGITLLCLLAFLGSQGICTHTAAASTPRCMPAMSHSMPMPASGHRSLPPCCVAHPSHSPAEAAAVIIDLSTPPPIGIPFQSGNELDLHSSRHILLAAPLSLSPTFRPPLRI